MSELPSDRPPTLLRRLIILLLLAGLATLVYGWIRRPAPPATGDTLHSAPGRLDERPRQTIRLANFNIQSGRGIDGDTDLLRTAKLLQSFDVISINEARGYWFGTPSNQVQELGSQLDLPWLFAPSERRFWHDSFGNGLLARAKIQHFSISPMPGTQWSGHRNIILARMPMDRCTLNIVVTHLDRVKDRATQFRIAAELFLALEPPVVLMGDLNTRGDDLMMQNLLHTAGVDDAIGDTDQLPSKERIDWILTRGLQTLEAGAVSTKASDHPMVWAQVMLPLTDIERPAQLTTRPATQPSTQPD